MAGGFPRVYTSFDQFEREELRKLDSMHTTIDDMLEERFSEELSFDNDDKPARKRRGRPPKNGY